METNDSLTKGTHHIGLTVSHLQDSADFFIKLLGWGEIKRNNDYPAIYVSDGTIMVTLWQTREEPVVNFDKNRNVGLHHVAFAVADEDILDKIHEKLAQNRIQIEFAPEVIGQGPAKHMICYEPSGNRIEFIWTGKS